MIILRSEITLLKLTRGGVSKGMPLFAVKMRARSNFKSF